MNAGSLQILDQVHNETSDLTKVPNKLMSMQNSFLYSIYFIVRCKGNKMTQENMFSMYKCSLTGMGNQEKAQERTL